MSPFNENYVNGNFNDEGYTLEYHVKFLNNLCRIIPVLNNNLINDLIIYKPEYYRMFKSFANRNNLLYVIIKVEDKRYIINPTILLSNYNQYGDNDICFDKYKIDSYPRTPLYRLCQRSIEHTQSFTLRITRYRILNDYNE